MFGSDVLEVAFGLVFVYLLMSMVCSAIREGLESLLQHRASDLERGIRTLLKRTDASRIYGHPLVAGLFPGSYRPERIKNDRYTKASELPDYIPARTFALALMDGFVPGTAARASGASDSLAPKGSEAGATLRAAREHGWVDAVGAGGADEASAVAAPSPIVALRQGVAALPPDDQLRAALLPLIDAAGDDIAAARRNIEDWFNDTMAAVSGWYKRRSQWIIFIIGAALAVVANVNTLNVAAALSRNDALRAGLVAQAEQFARESRPSGAGDLEGRLVTLRDFGLPIGWEHVDWSAIDAAWIFSSLLGWAVTAFAISLGAPFWFDLLNRIMVVRSTVKPGAKKKEE